MRTTPNARVSENAMKVTSAGSCLSRWRSYRYLRNLAMRLLHAREFGLSFGRLLIDCDGKVAANRVGIHDGDHVHRAALAPQIHGLSEGGGIDILVAEQLAAETNDSCVLFIQTGERAVISNEVDHLGVDSSPESAGLMPVPLKVVVGFAAGDQNREFARVRIQRSAGHGGVVEIQQSLPDARVIGSECERSGQGAILANKNAESL